MGADAQGHQAAAIPPDPFFVGAAFAKQYYLVLSQRPQDVHKFYTDVSKLTRAEASSMSVVTVTTMKGIHERVMSFEYGGLGAEIRSVDAQQSLNGGVLVMVTGSLSSNHSEAGRSFVQSFFLAPQEKGYYVLNDIFRFLDEEPAPQVVKHAVSSLANGVDNSHGSIKDQEIVEQPKEQVVREVVMDEASQVSAPSDIHEPQLQVQSEDVGHYRPVPSPVQDTPEQIEQIPELQLTEANSQTPPEVLGDVLSPSSVLESGEDSGPQPPSSSIPVPASDEPPRNPSPVVPEFPADSSLPTEAVATFTPPATDEPAPKKSYASIVQAMKARAIGAASGQPSSAAPQTQQPPVLRNPPAQSQSLLAQSGGRPSGGHPLSSYTPSIASVQSSNVIVATTNQSGLLAGVGSSSSPPVLPSPPLLGQMPQALGEGTEESGLADVEAEGRSIFVRNLPASIKKEEIADHFKQFGGIKVDRIQIRGNKQANPNTVYAFVEFDEPQGAQLAVEKQTILVKGSPVRIEEKKPASASRGVSRRLGQGRNDRQFRDGIRGRGSAGYGNRGNRAALITPADIGSRVAGTGIGPLPVGGNVQVRSGPVPGGEGMIQDGAGQRREGTVPSTGPEVGVSGNKNVRRGSVGGGRGGRSVAQVGSA